jgi:hypothetical protein
VFPVAVGGFHDHGIGMGRRRRVGKNSPIVVADVTGEQNPAAGGSLLQFQEDTGRTENMAGIEKGGADAWAEVIRGREINDIDKGVQAVEGVEGVVEGLDRFARFFFLLAL